MTTSAWRMSLSASAGLAFLLGLQALCGAEDRDPVPKLEERVKALEKLWMSGNQPEFYAETKRISRELSAAFDSGKNADKVARHLLELLLTKEFDARKIVPKDTDQDAAIFHTTDDLSVCDELTSRLASSNNSTAQSRREDAVLLCRWLGRIRSERIPNYVPTPILWPSQPDPNEVDYAKKKAKFDAVDKANIRNGRQGDLGSSDNGLIADLVPVLSEAFRAEPNSPILKQCMKDAKLTKEERKKVEEGIREAKEQEHPAPMKRKRSIDADPE